MKKLLFVALAAVGMTACVQNEELVVPQNTAAISFADAFVNTATKADPSTTTSSIEGFKVWACMDNVAGKVLEAEEVTKNGGVWSYYNTQYWFPNHTYYFAALSPIEGNWTVDTTNASTEGLGVVSFTNVEGIVDLLYAEKSVSTPQDAATLANQGMPAVALQFQHLLSKVKFTFQNGFATDKVTVEVKNVKMVAPKSATIDLAEATYNWDNHAEAVDLVFGETGVVESTKKAAATDERLTIPAPATQSYNVSFDVVVYQNGQKAMEVSKEATIEGLALEMGKAYNFTAVIDPTALDLHAIEFTATVEDWADGVATDVIKGKAISTAAELAEAVKTSGEYVLVNDIAVDADATMTVAAGEHVVLYLNGHTLTAESDETGSNRNVFDVRGSLVVNGGNETYTRNAAAGTIAYKHVGTNMGWNSSINIFNVTAGGVLELEGVTASVEGSDMAFVAHLNNWGEVTLIANNCTLESNYVPVRVFNSGPDMNNVTIKNSTLKGGSAAFWVHNYTVADFGTEAKAEAQKALLNLNIYEPGNTFSPDVNGIRYGFTNSVRTDAYGITKTVSEDGTEVTLGSLVEDGLIRRGVAGAEENTTIKKVVVEEGVAVLYDRTFRRFYALETVELPSTLTTIGATGSGVFQSCTNLKNIVLPENLTVLGKGSFQECTSLETINIPAGVTRIEENCLRNTGLVEVEFHEGVTYFGAQAFRDCKQLKKVVIKAPHFTVEANAFGVMSGALPGTVIEVANEEMKNYLESTLAYKNQFTIIVPAKVSNTSELATALANGGYIVLGDDITLAETLEIEGTATINLNGKTITATETEAIVAKAGADLTISGNGKVVAHSAPIRAIGGKVTVEGGEFTQTGDAISTPSTYRYSVDSREGGEIIIKGGTFKTINGMINVSANSSVVIEGGNFENTINSTITRHFAYVSGNLTIKGGEFKNVANSAAGGEFFCGAAATGKVIVEGGKFTSLWASGSKNRIWTSYYGGSIEVKGGLFNSNGGINTQVTENTDAATKDAYPYMAK